MEDVALSLNEDDPQLSKNENINIGKDIFVLSLGEFEGPIDLLLDLAQKQKVDLKEVSILDLADQYLDFINNAITNDLGNNLERILSSLKHTKVDKFGLNKDLKIEKNKRNLSVKIARFISSFYY